MLFPYQTLIIHEVTMNLTIILINWYQFEISFMNIGRTSQSQKQFNY